MPTPQHAPHIERLTYRCPKCQRTATFLDPTQPCAAPRCAHCDVPMELIQLVRQVRFEPRGRSAKAAVAPSSTSHR